MNTKGKPNNKKRDVRSFEISKRGAKLLDLAINASGKRLSDIVNDAIEKHLKTILLAIRKDRDKEFQKFLVEWERGESAISESEEEPRAGQH